MSSRKSVPTRETDPAAGPDSVSGAGGASIKRNNRQPPWEKEAVQNESSSFGDWLRRQREMREISLRDIADRTKISLRYLEAMEADRFDLLPAAVFAKGFLREYARYVGLSPDDVVNHYLSVNHPEEQEPAAKDDKIRPKPRPIDPGQPSVRRNWSSGLLLALVALVLLVLVGLAVWFVDRRHESPANSRQAPPGVVVPPAPAPKPAVAPAAPPQPSAPLQVSLDFTQDCWVEAVIDGKNRSSELRVQGESLQLEAEKSIVLTLGNAGAVEVQVNGYPLDLGKKKGDVVHDLLIDLNTVQALKAKKETR
ncbi:MAG TPA: helix-turn-helix domain-containing protein [Thermoanaerobaculia bacterium]|nr:helix-turn-helix domain-containing protein [Thermoanaerobaculia bacterium]